MGTYRAPGKTKHKSVKAKSVQKMGSKRKLSRFGKEQRLRRRQRRAQIGGLLRSKADRLRAAGFDLDKAAEAEDATAGGGLGPAPKGPR